MLLWVYIYSRDFDYFQCIVDNTVLTVMLLGLIAEELYVPCKMRDKDELCIIKVEGGYCDDEDECYGGS